MHARLRAILLILVGALALSIAPPSAAQDVPPFLSHQGRLFDADNVALSGVQTLTFRVHDAADDTGVELWSETVDVTTANGYYSVVLGQTAALPDSVFDGSTRYLGVTVGDATVVDELTPRLEVTSVAYALKSAVAENAIGDLTPTSIQVGGAQVAPNGTITLGAATINADGSIVVGNTTIGADGAISVSGNPVIGADGSVDSGAFSGTTLSDLETGGCATGQLVQFDAVGGWGCITPAAGTAYSAGAGLTLDATDTFSVDPTQVQTRLSGACNAGEFMLGANQDGSVNCAVEHTYTGGSGVVVTTVGDASTIGVDFGVAQQRVTGTCTGTDKITAINADGTVACSPDVDTDTTYAAGAGVDITAGTISLIDTVDDDTTYSAGTGIDITGTTISLVDTVDDDTTYSAGTGIDITGTTISLVDATDDDTTYSAGSGLTLSGTTFDVDTAAIQARVVGSCAAGEKLLGINVDGSVSCATDADTTYAAGTGISIAGTTISLVDTTDDDTTYTAGTGLTLAGTQFAIDNAVVHTDAEAATHAGTPDAHHTRYQNSEAITAVSADLANRIVDVDGVRFDDGTTITTASGSVINVTYRINSTRRALAGASNIVMETFNVDKKSATSVLIIQGSLSGWGDASGDMQQAWLYGTGTEVRAQSVMYDNTAFSKVYPTYAVIEGHSTTGVQPMRFRYYANNGGAGNRPFRVYNPNSTDEGRMAQTQSTYIVWEIEP